MYQVREIQTCRGSHCSMPCGVSVQVEAFPGARFKQLTSIVSKCHKFSNKGASDRRMDGQKAVHMSPMRNMHRWAQQRAICTSGLKKEKNLLVILKNVSLHFH